MNGNEIMSRVFVDCRDGDGRPARLGLGRTEDNRIAVIGVDGCIALVTTGKTAEIIGHLRRLLLEASEGER